MGNGCEIRWLRRCGGSKVSDRSGHHTRCLGHFITRLTHTISRPPYLGLHPPIQQRPTAFPCVTTGSAPCAGPASPGGSRGNAERALGAFLSDKSRRWESDIPPPLLCNYEWSALISTRRLSMAVVRALTHRSGDHLPRARIRVT